MKYPNIMFALTNEPQKCFKIYMSKFYIILESNINLFPSISLPLLLFHFRVWGKIQCNTHTSICESFKKGSDIKVLPYSNRY